MVATIYLIWCDMSKTLRSKLSCSLTSTSALRSEPFGSELNAHLLRDEDSRVAAGIFNDEGNRSLGKDARP